MFGVFVAALGKIIGWLFGSAVVKWGVTALLFFGFTLFLDIALDLFPSWFSSEGLSNATSVFTPEIWYFIDYFNVQLGISMVLGAYVARFLVRRIPFIG
jgi:hypothetical protein